MLASNTYQIAKMVIKLTVCITCVHSTVFIAHPHALASQLPQNIVYWMTMDVHICGISLLDHIIVYHSTFSDASLLILI